MAKEIELQNGMKAIVDDEDFERVNQFDWWTNKHENSATLQVKGNVGLQEQKIITLPHFILETNSKNKCITFKNQNRLDCRKSNLIIGGREIVDRNRRGNRNSTSKYKGVYWDKSIGKWKSELCIKGKRLRLGSFETEEEAADAYNQAVIKHKVEHAYLNTLNKDNSAETLVFEKGFQQRTKRRKNPYRGINRTKNGKWQVRITSNQKVNYLGVYGSEIEAAKAYNEKAKELFGDKAILNEIPEEVTS